MPESSFSCYREVHSSPIRSNRHGPGAASRKTRHRVQLLLDRGTFGIPIPGSRDVVTRSIKWEDLLKMVEGIMADPDSRQARLEGLKNLWKN